MADPAPREIIIVKRRNYEDDGYHGGAWKIALADFMTAMMALFLVLWLIGSTTKETKSMIAEYFNPLKLADTSYDRKGLRDPGNQPTEPGGEGETKLEDGRTKGNGETKGDDKGASLGIPGSREREAALFHDPYSVLARLAAEADHAADVASADAVASEAGLPGLTGGEAARDPFDPLYWQVAPLTKMRTDQPGAVRTAAAPPAGARIDARAALPNATASGAIKVASAELGDADAKALAAIPLPSGKLPDSKASEMKSPDSKPSETKPLEGSAAKDPSKEPSKDTMDLAEQAAMAEIKAEIAKAMQPLGMATPAPQTEVRRTGEGILISLTDEANFSMFGVGSAEPQPKVVRALEQVARILKTRPGRIVVRGHTDARPFRSETYDNWRLSSARAQMAAYMLIRGGVDDARLERIEGYADRLPRNAADTKAAENRRIEILLRGRPE